MIDTFQYAICCLALTLPALIAIQFVYAPKKYKPLARNTFVTGHDDFAEGLVKALGLGQGVTSICIMVDAGEVVKVRVEQYLNEEQATKILGLVEKHKAVEMES
jgi:hypothetical protein